MVETFTQENKIMGRLTSMNGYIDVTTAGTPVRATANLAAPNNHVACQTIVFEQMQGNTGKLYICDSATANKTTGVGVLLIIPAPTLVDAVAVLLPYASFSVPSAPAALSAENYYIDADVDGDDCLVSIITN